MAKLVSKTYGDALFELALEEGKLDLLADEVKAVSEIISDNGDLTKLMNHPQIDKEEKVKIIENIFKNRISDELFRTYGNDHREKSLQTSGIGI